MKRDHRRKAIIDLLIESRSVELTDLAARYSVSKMTIHRDLDELEKAGLLRKIRGGATIDANNKFESDFRIREMQDQDLKRCIARAALDLIEPGMTVMINDGSTAALLGDMIDEKRPLTIITNNAAVIESLQRKSGIVLIALGGTYSSIFNGYFGVITEQALSNLRADIAFISTPSVSGVRAFHMDEAVAQTKCAMMRSAQKTCLLVNHSRFGRTALHAFADLNEFDVIITDKALPDDQSAILEQAGIELTVAKETP